LNVSKHPSPRQSSTSVPRRSIMSCTSAVVTRYDISTHAWHGNGGIVYSLAR
jgi:hypothetical protein